MKDINSIADLLKRHLRGLPEPLLTSNLYVPWGRRGGEEKKGRGGQRRAEERMEKGRIRDRGRVFIILFCSLGVFMEALKLGEAEKVEALKKCVSFFSFPFLSFLFFCFILFCFVLFCFVLFCLTY